MSEPNCGKILFFKFLDPDPHLDPDRGIYKVFFNIARESISFEAFLENTER